MSVTYYQETGSGFVFPEGTGKAEALELVAAMNITQLYTLEEWREQFCSLDTLRNTKLSTLKTTYTAALAGTIALADPSPSSVALEAALWAVEDPEGLEYARDRLAAEYARLQAAIMVCGTLEELEKMETAFHL